FLDGRWDAALETGLSWPARHGMKADATTQRREDGNRPASGGLIAGPFALFPGTWRRETAEQLPVSTTWSGSRNDTRVCEGIGSETWRGCAVCCVDKKRRWALGKAAPP